MKEKLSQIQEYVSTQYGDLTGVIQIDGHSSITSIYELCKDYDFETENIFIVGFGMGESTISGVGEEDSIYCKILYVRKSDYGNNFDEISKKFRSIGEIVLEQKNIDIKYSDLKKYIKRFEFIAVSDLIDFASKIEINEK